MATDATAGPSAGVRAIGINHAALEVGNVDEALEWWGRFLDFELRGRRARMAEKTRAAKAQERRARAGDRRVAPMPAPNPQVIPHHGRR